MLFVSSYVPLYVLLVIKNIFERITDGGRFLDVRHKIKSTVEYRHTFSKISFMKLPISSGGYNPFKDSFICRIVSCI